MNLFDLTLGSAMVVAAVAGYRLGFLARAASWVGLALGLVLAARFLPSILDALGGSDAAAKLSLAAGILLGSAFAGQAIGLVVGNSLRRAVPVGPARAFDRAVGAGLGVLGTAVVAWFLLPALADMPGTMAHQARSSVIANAIDDLAPPPPDTMAALRRLIGETNFPRVFEGLQPAPDTGPPPGALALAAPTVGRVSASTVKVQGTACRRVHEGSGFAVAPELVVTNAHVVAGQRSTRVQRPDGRFLTATVVQFDPDRDLALLRVPGLGQAPLPVGSARPGVNGAVFGHPGGQVELRVAPAAIRQRLEARGRDIYDSRTTVRDVYVLASNLRPGDSGGALTDTNGAVVGVAFAIAPDKPGTAYAVTSRELNAVLARPRSGPVSTGPCLSRG